MDVTSIDELKELFEGKINGLTKCMDLSSAVLTPGGLDESCRHQLAVIHRELGMAESLLAQMKSFVYAEKEQLERAKDLKAKMEDRAKHVHYLESHIPNRLPGYQPKTAPTKKKTKGRTPLEAIQDTQRSLPSNEGDVPTNSRRKKPIIPRMEFMTVEEFDAVPKYMKGRLSYDSVNVAVEIINSAVNARYLLLHKPRSALGDKAMKKVRRLKEQENKDTKGVFFFTDEDFKGSSDGRCSSNSRSIFTILRHCGRLREIRSTGLTRYALVP